MTAETQAIVTAYESEELTPEFISEDRRLDLTAVKATLMQFSSKYRKDCGQEDENEDALNFSKDEQLRVKNMMLDLALGAEDEHLRAKMAVIIRDDAKGRRDVVKNLNGANYNVLMINKLIQNGRNTAENLKQKMLGSMNGSQQKAINV
jgi:hypothetical protein